MKVYICVYVGVYVCAYLGGGDGKVQYATAQADNYKYNTPSIYSVDLRLRGLQ